MPNKNQSKSDKKTRKYKQHRAQLLAEVAQLKKETEKLNKEGAEQSKKTDKKFEEVGEKFEEVNEQLERVGKKIEEVYELQRVNSEELTKTVEGLRQVRIASEKAVIASEKNGEEVKEVVEGLRQVRIASEKAVIASEKNGEEVKEVVEGLRQVRIASEKAVIASEKVRIASKKNGKRIGRIGNNLGRYTEAMATPSIRGILEREFNADFRGWLCAGSPKYEADLEVDAWGVSRNGTGDAYVVEIKRKFHEKHINQVWQIVKRFRVNLPEYRRRAVYPMLAVVDISEEGREKVWNAGIHLIEINDGVFRYAQPPQDFEADGYHGMRGVRKDVPHLRAVPG